MVTVDKWSPANQVGLNNQYERRLALLEHRINGLHQQLNQHVDGPPLVSASQDETSELYCPRCHERRMPEECLPPVGITRCHCGAAVVPYTGQDQEPEEPVEATTEPDEVDDWSICDAIWEPFHPDDPRAATHEALVKVLAEQGCPQCGSDEVRPSRLSRYGGGGHTRIAMCADCGAVWEPRHHAAIQTARISRQDNELRQAAQQERDRRLAERIEEFMSGGGPWTVPNLADVILDSASESEVARVRRILATDGRYYIEMRGGAEWWQMATVEDESA